MRVKFLISTVLLVMLAGCQSKQPHQTQKAAATEQWNGARAGVLGGLASEQYKGGNLDKARLTVNSALALNPKSAQLHLLSARIAMEQGQLDAAEKELKQAQLLDPKDPEADYLCGVVYQRWQKPLDAYQCYQQASFKNPTELGYVLASGEMLVELSRADEALELLQGKLSSFEHSAVLRDAVGQLLAGQKKFPQAVEMLRQASIFATDELTIKDHLAQAMFYNGQYRESLDLLQKLVSDERYSKRVDLYLAIGECYEHLGRFADGRAAFETATQINPSLPQAWTSLAKVALESNDFRRAELSLAKAISLDSAASEPQLLLGYVRLRQNRPDDALPLFQKAAALDRADPTCLCMIGYVLEKTGQHDQAIEFYARALRLRPGDELATKLMASIDKD